MTITTNEVASPGTSLVLFVPDYDTVKGGNQSSLMRLGAYDNTDEASIVSKIPTELLVDGKPPPGWLEYTEGDRTQAMLGTVRESIGGDYFQYIAGKAEINVGSEYRFNISTGTLKVYNADPIYKIEFFEQDHIYAGGKTTWRKREMGHVSADTYSFGDTENFFAGYKFDATFGMTNGIFIGGKLDFSLAISVGLTFGYAVNLGASVSYSNVKGGDIKVAADHDIKGRSTIDLRIKPELLDPAPSMSRNHILAAIAAVSGTVVAAGIAAGSAGGDVSKDGTSAAPAGCLAGASVAFTIGMVVSLVLALKEKASPKHARSRILMNTTSVTISRNNVAGTDAVSEVKVDGDGVGLLHNDISGQTPRAILCVGSTGEPRRICLENAHGSLVDLCEDSDVGIQAGRDLYLQTNNHRSVLKLGTSGTIRITSTQAQLDGERIRVGRNNELYVG